MIKLARAGLFVAVLCFLLPNSVFGALASCYVCRNGFVGNIVYLFEDKVTRTQREVCHKCAFELPNCYRCSVPVLTNAPGTIQFEDSRVLCARDARTAVVDPAEALRICEQMTDQLQRQFSRFTLMPETNLTFETIDRLHLENLFKLVGNDYTCPNVLGFTETKTNSDKLQHHISILSGLPRSTFRSVCAHECAHAWIVENVTAARRKSLSQPAGEGFCELVAYLAAEALQDEEAKTEIMANAYTRGQIALFVEAEKRYTVSDVIDWIKYGVDDRLGADLLRLRNIEVPRTSPAAAAGTNNVPWAPEPARTFNSIVLKAIFWNPQHPAALINQKTIGPGEECSLIIAGTNLSVRCLEIRKDAVRLELLLAREQMLLHLGETR